MAVKKKTKTKKPAIKKHSRTDKKSKTASASKASAGKPKQRIKKISKSKKFNLSNIKPSNIKISKKSVKITAGILIVILALSVILLNLFSESLILDKADKEFKSLNFEDAADYYKLASVFNKDAEVFSKLGWSHFELKEYDKAKQYFEKSIELNEGEESAMEGIAFTYLMRGNFEQSEKAFRKIYINNPDNVDALKGLTIISYYTGDQESYAIYSEKLKSFSDSERNQQFEAPISK